MDIKDFGKIIDACSKKQDLDKMTLGMNLFHMYEMMGWVSREIKQEHKSKTKPKEVNVASIVSAIIALQESMGVMYKILQKRNATLTSAKNMTLLKNNLTQAEIKYPKGGDLIWVTYNLFSSLGKITQTFNMRTTANDDTFRMSHLMEAQSYLFVIVKRMSEKYPEMLIEGVNLSGKVPFMAYFNNELKTTLESPIMTILRAPNYIVTADMASGESVSVESSIPMTQPVVGTADRPVQKEKVVAPELPKEQIPPRLEVPANFKNMKDVIGDEVKARIGLAKDGKIPNQ